MVPVLFLILGLAGSASEPAWEELTFTIERDFGVSSDTATLCRVRVINHGSHTWPGRRIGFLAEALEGGRVVESARGRFGLTLAPHDTLETAIGFSGRYDRFTVRPEPSESGRTGGIRKRKATGVKKRRRR